MIKNIKLTILTILRVLYSTVDYVHSAMQLISRTCKTELYIQQLPISPSPSISGNCHSTF